MGRGFVMPPKPMRKSMEQRRWQHKTVNCKNDTQWPLWEVFTQKKAGLPFEHAGSLHAPDREMALQNARDVYSRRNEAICLWVVPSDAIASTTPGDEIGRAS